MRFYLCTTEEGRKRLVTRHDEAKKIDKSAEQIDIPVDQAGIKQAFEELFDQIFDLEKGESLSPGEAEALDSRPEASPPSKPSTKQEPAALTLQAVCEWILDQATTAQIEQVFARVGTRFSELIKIQKD